MTDKKLTDNDIKKALERYKNVDDNDITTTSFKTILLKEVYLLINRLEAENERLENEAFTYKIRWAKAEVRETKAKAEATKECIEKVKAEIKSWTYNFGCYSDKRDALERFDKFSKELVDNQNELDF